MIDRTLLQEYEPNQFCVDASELGWKPGYWPEEFEADVGNKQKFVVRGGLPNGGRTYSQLFGCVDIAVFND